MAFIDDAGERALDEAIDAVEQRSRAELVVVVRPSSASYLAQDLVPSAIAAWAMLAFQLYGPPEFELWTMLLAPPLVGLGVFGLVRLLTPLRAVFVPERSKREAVRQAAESWFFRKGIRYTRERTGLLVYVSLFERRVEVLADSGIDTRVPEAEWRAVVDPLEQVFEHEDASAQLLAERVAALAEPLERWCERRADDIDELPNRVDREEARA